MFSSLSPMFHGLSLTALCVIVVAKELPNPPPRSAVETAAKIPTGNPAKCNISQSLFFTAVIDHALFNGNWSDLTQKFLQQYLIIDKFYKPGNPIFLIPDGENAVRCLEQYWYTDLAEEFEALVVRPEHRYFGLSTPHGLNYSEAATWNPKKLKELTLDNIEMDIMTFLAWLKKDSGYEGCGDSKVAIMGVRFLHWRYLNVFSATWTGAMPTNFVTDPDRIFADTLAAWVHRLSSAARHIVDVLTNPGPNPDGTISGENRPRKCRGVCLLCATGLPIQFDGLQEKLHLCTAPNATEQLNDLLSSILKVHIQAAQQNHRHIGSPFEQIVADTLKLDDPMEVIGASIWAMISKQTSLGSAKGCLPWELVYSPADPFSYILCTITPMPPANSPAGSIWGHVPYSPKDSAHLLDDYCQGGFGINQIDGGAAYQRKLGLDRENLRQLNHTVFNYGLDDPTSAVGPSPWKPSMDTNAAPFYWVANGAHGSEAYKPSANDSESVKAMRTTIRNIFHEWLDDAE